MKNITFYKIALKQALSFILFVFILPVSVQAQEPGVVWAKKFQADFYYAGGSSTDASGNTYMTGAFSGMTNFGDTSLTSAGDSDIFVVKTNKFGTVLWAERFGGGGLDAGTAITTDASGNVYTVGRFSSTVTFGSVTLTTPITHRSLFVVKQNSSGTVLWAKQFSSPWTQFPGDFYAPSITVDSQGNVYTSGRFIADTVVFEDITLNHISVGFNAPYDTFVVKQNASGEVLWAKNFGAVEDTDDTTVYVRSKGITTDSSDNVYITGTFGNTANFDDVALTGAATSGSAFLTKINPSGDVVWAKRFGEAGMSFVAHGLDIATDSVENVYVTGVFSGEMNVGTTTLTSNYHTTYETYLSSMFVLKTDSSGEGLWAEAYLNTDNGFTNASGNSISVDTSGNMYVTGSFVGTVDFNGFALTTEGEGDIFVLKINNWGVVEWAERFGSVNNDGGNYINLDVEGNMYVVGAFMGTVDFGDFSLTSASSGEIFLMRISPDGTMAIEQNQSEHYKVYPNPVKDLITIELSELDTETTVEVFNLLGQKVMTFDTFYGTKTLDLSEFTAGIYLLKINDTVVKIKKQ